MLATMPLIQCFRCGHMREVGTQRQLSDLSLFNAFLDLLFATLIS
jgi:hypothetical protein